VNSVAAFRKFKVDWRAKSFAFNVFDRILFGEKIYFLFQKYITKTAPRRLSPTSKSGAVPIAHAQAIVSQRSDFSSLTLLEIGAGWDLYTNMIYYCYGINHQIAIDVRRWGRAELVNAVIRHLQSDPPEGHIRLPTVFVSEKNLDADLKRLYGIEYMAPYDATNTSLSAQSIDVITTTSVLEHVPEDIIHKIFKEYARIFKKNGLMRHVIDYSDHYSHADPKITPFNMLQFSENDWQKHNPGIHYQNRLRTRDFTNMLEYHGFSVKSCSPWSGLSSELNTISLDPMFKKYSNDELLELGATFTVALK
jgi:hypothetical protein